MVAANGGAELAVKPRSWRLPREVTSTTPLPCVRAATHSAVKAASDMVPIGKRRTSKPSPVAIGADRPGQAPRRRGLASA